MTKVKKNKDTGRIVKILSNDYTISIDGEFIVCKSRGRFRNDNIKPVVGDIVIVDVKNKYVLEVLPRTNELKRPLISNVDQAVIITSVKEPDFSTNLLDKLLTVIEYNNIKPIICITKMDLLTNEEKIEILKEIKYYQKIGYDVYMNDDLDNIKLIFKSKVSVFTGQTGSGKSTLLNMLSPELNIKTGEISKALGRGKHTTRHVELIELFDGLVADTPGFSSIDFHDMENSDIRDNFIEFNQYKDGCKYRDCMHDREDQCHIKELVKEKVIKKTRYENYLKFISENEG